MATESSFEAVLDRLHARRSGAGWVALCPAHEDRNPSLSVSFDNGRILFHCHAGCSQESVLAKLGPIEVAHYDYTDENGKLLYQVVRYEPKEFRQRRPGTNGHEWIYKLDEVRRVLYRLQEVTQAKAVVILEGERDVETARALGFVATTNAMGAGKWRPEYTESLRGKHVVICPDNDKAGEKHSELLKAELKGVAATVSVARVPEKYKDLSEWNPPREGFSFLIKHAELVSDEPKNWRELFHSYEEFENAPPLSFAIDGFLQNDAITAIAGLSGHGKTFLALSIVKALLRGEGKLWDLFKIKERAERLVYLIPESTITPFKHRLKLLDVYRELQERLLVRTLSKGDTPKLDDPRLLFAVRGAYVILDTGIRFIGEADDNNASEMARSLSDDLSRLLRAGARAILVLFHSSKEFRKAEVMNLENMIRGSGELGAILATAWGIKQIDDKSVTIYVQNIKPRDFEPCGPFELMLRPSIDQEADLRLWKGPDSTGALHEEQPELNPRNAHRKESRAANLALYKKWTEEEPELSTEEIRKKFEGLGIGIKDVTIRGYRHEVNRRAS